MCREIPPSWQGQTPKTKQNNKNVSSTRKIGQENDRMQGFVVWGRCHGYLDRSAILGAADIAGVKAEDGFRTCGRNRASVQPGRQ